jgi:lipopolysaccharide-induced tumor necrosis factor-alpha factor
VATEVHAEAVAPPMFTSVQETMAPPTAPLYATTPPAHTAAAPLYATASPGQVGSMNHLGRNPTSLVCPYCQQPTVTRTADQVDGITILLCILLLLLFWPLFWLPLCIPSCKATHHYCTKCNKKLGKTDPCS